MNVLYISYNGLAEPLGRSQILPYVQGLSQAGHSFVVISFEKDRSATTLSPEEVRALLPSGVRWIPLRYHKRPSVPATAWDVLHGTLQALGAPRPDLVHARATIPALMAAPSARLRGVPWLFDVRGLLAQEYVDGRHWRQDGLLSRVAERFEQRLLRSADALVFLTGRAARAKGASREGRPLAVIPCAVDLERFSFRPEARARIRAHLGLRDEPLAVYSGSLGSWYLHDQMLDFVATSRVHLPRLHFLVLTPQREIMERAADRKGLLSVLRTCSVSPHEVPDYLSAADFGLSFIDPAPSKAASSPTKLAEYLACGLPAVLNSGVGDADELSAEPAWVLVRELDASGYRDAARRVGDLLARPDRHDVARELAATRFSLSEAVRRYDALYRELAALRKAA